MSVKRLNNLVGLLAQAVHDHGPSTLFLSKQGGRWVPTSYEQFATLVDNFRGGLASLGIGRGDRVAIAAGNRVRWAVAAYACYGLGAAVVPIYEAQRTEERAHIMADSGAVALIAALPEIIEHSRALATQIPALRHVIGLQLPPDDPTSYQALCRLGERRPSAASEPGPDEIACLLYTPGTTGQPKGVVLSHGNITSNVRALGQLFPITSADRSVSFLPWAHSFGHTCELHTMIHSGATMAICTGPELLADAMREMQPTLIIAVPQIFNRGYRLIRELVQKKPLAFQTLFNLGIDLALKQQRSPLRIRERLTLAAADKVAFSQVRAAFGGRLRYSFCGGAALSKRVWSFFDALGIRVFHGYGLTEAGPVVSTNSPDAYREGSVGKPVSGVRVVIDKSAVDDEVRSLGHGEIIVYGPGVSQGYHNLPEDNAGLFTADGGLRTGDVGRFDSRGFLYITGRIKERYKLANGMYVVPAPLEDRLKLSPFIVNAMIYGEDREHNIALVVPHLDTLSKWAERQGLRLESTDELLQSNVVRARVHSEIEAQSERFKAYERIRDFALIATDFTTQNGLLTPAGRLRREAILKLHRPLIDALYRAER